MIAINYERNTSKHGDYGHVITIYYNVTENEDFEYLTKDSEKADCWKNTYYKYSNGDITDNNKYILEDDLKTYYVTVKKSLFSTKYIFD